MAESYGNELFDSLFSKIETFDQNVMQNHGAAKHAKCDGFVFWDQQIQQQQARFSDLQKEIGEIYDKLEGGRCNYWTFPALVTRKQKADKSFDKTLSHLKSYDEYCVSLRDVFSISS